MAQAVSVPFRDRSISELVQELNNLGDGHVAMQPTALIAIQDAESDSIRRFRSRSMNKSRATTSRVVQQSEFFLADGSQKKYYYSEIANELETTTIASILSQFESGFNTTVVMQSIPARFVELLYKIQPWFEEGLGDNTFLAYFLEYQVREAYDLLSGPVPQAMPLSESLSKDHPFYETTIKSILKIKNGGQNSIQILTMMRKNSQTQLRIVLLPTAMMAAQVEDAGLKIVRTQLTQILNYIKTYPNKKYENINKLLPKRYPTTTAIAEILLYDSANYIINWVTENSSSKGVVNGRFDFFDRFAGVSNLIKKSNTTTSHSFRIIKQSRSVSKSRSSIQGKFNCENEQVDSTKTRTAIYGVQQSRSTNPMNELELCRTFQRKTHKYSVDEFGQQKPEPLFPQMGNFNPLLNESQAIAVLKSQHARQISHYHQTIQNLNQKILVLTSSKGFSEIYTIHEREIMLLQLKIEQLRKDIATLSSKATGSKQAQSLKAMIKKLNEEVSHHQKSNPTHKIAQGKIKMLDKELAQFKGRYQKSEEARQQLTYELEAMTKRLKIKDSECGNLKEQEAIKYSDDDLAAKDLRSLEQIEQILGKDVNKDSAKHVMRRVKNILGDLSEVRQVVLECNNFLVDLQDHLESRLSEKDPDVVLDCNRFIRSYLLQNLNIF